MRRGRAAAVRSAGVARIRLALYLGADGHKLGPGKIRLLEAIRDEGSISAAARSMGMAYRHAWELVDDLNRCFRTPVVTASIGGRAGGGAALTPWGDELVRRFHEIEDAAEGAIERKVQALDAHSCGGPQPGRRRRSARLGS